TEFDREVDPVRSLQLFSQLGRRIPQLDRRADGPQRVVLMERRQPEDAEDCVADELFDRAAMALENGGGDPRVAVEDGVDRLRVELFSESGRADQIGEDHGRRPARTNSFLLGPGGRLRRSLRVGQLYLELRVMSQHAALELPERLARLEAELVGEQAAGLAVDVERLGLTSRAVQGEHQEASQPLPERMLGDEGLQLGDDRPLKAAAEVGLEAIFERLQTQFLETLGLAAKRRRLQPGECGPAPERESVAKEGRRPLAVSRAERLVSFA